MASIRITLATVFGLLGVSFGAALANPPEPKATVVPPRLREVTPHTALTDVPAECRQFLAVPTDSQSVELPWMQRLSLAACEEAAVASPTEAHADVTDLAALVTDLEQTVAPSIALYRDAQAHAPTARIRLLAASHLGSAYASLLVRARVAIGTPGALDVDATSASEFAAAHARLEPLLAREQAEAIRAFTAVLALTTQNPGLADTDEVTHAAVEHARTNLAALCGGDHPQPACAAGT